MSSKCRCFKLPAFIFTYPFTVLLIARLYSLICLLAILYISYAGRKHVGREVTLVAIADIIALLFMLIAMWLMLQKFFYIKLDAALTLTSIIFIIGGLIAACSLEQIVVDSNHIFYIIISHFYLFISQLFTLGWSLLCTRNSVSRLFILDWGKSVTQTELQQLDGDF
ncbi:Protein F57B1.5 [Aphelenchoides bicaudatus]|nr:Protein F57B1.5 [Aphelenchoides bicaudatus]